MLINRVGGASGAKVGDTVTINLSGAVESSYDIWTKSDVDSGSGIDIDESGNVYCSHYLPLGAKTLRKLDSSGNEIWSKTDIKYCNDVRVRDGYVYCAYNDGLRKLDSAGNEVWYKTTYTSPNRIAVDASGNIYVTYANQTTGGVRKFDSAGNVVWSKTDIPYGIDVAVDLFGNVYCTYGGTSVGKYVRKLDSSGNEIWSKTDVPQGSDIAVDYSGNVYCSYQAASGKMFRKLDSSGNEIWSKSDDLTFLVRGIALDAQTNCIYLATGYSSYGFRKLDSSGTEIWHSSSNNANFTRIRLDANGNTYSIGGGTGLSSNIVYKRGLRYANPIVSIP